MSLDSSGHTVQLLDKLRIDRPPVPPRVHRKSLPYALAVIAIAGGACATWAWRVSQTASVHQVTVATAQSQRKDGATAVTREASGYVVARRTATVSAQITGVVTDVLFEEGDHVLKGQLLAKLDSSYAAAALDASTKQLAASEQLALQYRAQSEQADRDSRRAIELAGTGMISLQSAEQAATKASELKAQLASQLRSIEAADAQRQIARVNLAYTEIRSPFSGVITSKAAQVGETISPSASAGYTRTGIATIVDMNSLEVEVDIGEAYIGDIAAQMTAQVRLNAYPDLLIPAKVAAIIPTADRGKATVKARIELMLKDPRILPDMGALVSFIGDRQPNSEQSHQPLLIPHSAVAASETGDVVHVVSSDMTLQRRSAVPGEESGNQHVALKGLGPGEHVVPNPSPALDNINRVSIRAERATQREAQ